MEFITNERECLYDPFPNNGALIMGILRGYYPCKSFQRHNLIMLHHMRPKVISLKIFARALRCKGP